MDNVVSVEYARTGESMKVDLLGMRTMQVRAFAARRSQYLLLKAPPASGKSRALMFLALDKLVNQGVRKVIVAVPERSIGASFASTKLTKSGFFMDWVIESKNDLCGPGEEGGKIKSFKRFLADHSQILLCTHATLRFAFDEIENAQLEKVLIAVDEFHHVSVDESNQLGAVLATAMSVPSVHIVAMTGSYFRGDSVPVLKPEEEAKFTRVTFNYYEQLNGYIYLKSLGIGYHFYQGSYLSAIGEVLDTNRKTIIHIPNVNAGESTKDKYDEVDGIIDVIGRFIKKDPQTGVITVERKSDKRIIKVADLVDDDPNVREKIVTYLRGIKLLGDIDIIIALGMAKEGFDWPYCERALTVGYRGSLTEIVQIIGRCTRDSDNKSHAQFTNLIAQPAAADAEVKVAVNNILKAITCSLLMEQVMAPNFKFKRKKDESDKSGAGVIKIRGFKEPSTQRVKNILETDLNEIKAAIFQDDTMLKAMPGNLHPEVMNRVLVARIVREKYPDLSPGEVEEVRQAVVIDSVVKSAKIKESGGKKFIRMAGKFVNIDELNIDLIDSINPFQEAFEILSKSVTTHVLKIIQEAIQASRIHMDADEAVTLWPRAKEFVKEKGREPDLGATDPLEVRLAECLLYLKDQRRQMGV